MTVEVIQIEKAADELRKAMKLVPEQIKRLEKEINICDQETQDLLHLIEFSSFNASEGYYLCKDLQITRQKRRQCKDELEGLRSVEEKMKVNRSLTDQFNVLSNVIEHRKTNIRTRSYKPRVRTDLVERFNKCNKSKLLK